MYAVIDYSISHMIQYPANTIHRPGVGHTLAQHWIDVSCFLGTHQARRFGPMLGQSLASVVDAGTTQRQRWLNLSCFLDMRCTGPVLVLCSPTLDGNRLSASCVFLMYNYAYFNYHYMFFTYITFTVLNIFINKKNHRLGDMYK